MKSKRITGKTPLLSLALIALTFMAACAPTQTPAPTSTPTAEPPPTATSAPTATEAAVVDPTATQASAAPDPANSGMTRFVVVPDKTNVSYSVEETFLNENNRLATAIGKTSQVTGELSVNLSEPSKIDFGEFSVDISTLTSDSGRRDNAIRGRWLESSRFPIARYTVTGLDGFPANPQEGQSLAFKMNGDLTVREATLPLTWDVTAVKNGSTITGEATTFIMMADWGVPPPNIAGVLIVKDGVTLTIEFTFEQQS